MATFALDNIELLLDAISIIAQVVERADVRCSPEMLSLIASHPSCRFIAELQLGPQFFSLFYFRRILHFRIMLGLFRTIMFDMASRGFTSMTFTLFEFLHLVTLSFAASLHTQGHAFYRELTLLPPEEKEYVGEIDYRTFVAIDSQEFRHIVEESAFSYCDTICVTLTDSRVKFHVAAKEFTFTKEEMTCMIGGLAPGEETQFLLTLRPMMFFHDLTYWSERIWLFRSTNSYSAIIVPIGLHAQFLIYFPQGCYVANSRL